MTSSPGSVTAAEAGNQNRAADAPAPSGKPFELAPCIERIGILRLAGWRLGVAGRHCSGLLEISSPTSLPRSPAHVLGVTHLRGKIIPVFDLGLPLGIDRDAGAGETPATGLVVAAGGMSCVLAADEIVAFDDVDLQQMSELETDTPARLCRFGRGRLRHHGHDVVVLEVPALLEALRFRGESGTGDGFEKVKT